MTKKRSNNQPKKIQNRRARFDYDLSDDFIAGIQLTGVETKALRLGHGHLRGAFINEKNNELYLNNATITGFSGAEIPESDQIRPRKLLLKRREINQLIEFKNSGLNLIPTELLTGSRYIKLRFGVGRSRKKYDKRQAIKKRDQQRDINRAKI